MKNILSILLVSVLLFGCSKEDEIQDTVLDSLLYGHWENYYNGSNYNMVLSSNGQFVYWRDDSSGNDNGGDWWVEGSTLVLSGDQYDIGGTYSVSGNSLEWDDRSWDK
jgi:hypothetical protein